jgi:hypothetical protein
LLSDRHQQQIVVNWGPPARSKAARQAAVEILDFRRSGLPKPSIAQLFGIDADALTRAFAHIPTIIEVVQQRLMAGALLVVHPGPGTCQPLGIGFGIDRLGERGGPAAFDTARVGPVGDVSF